MKSDIDVVIILFVVVFFGAPLVVENVHVTIGIVVDLAAVVLLVVVALLAVVAL